MFRYPTTLKLRDTDAAGVAFFASYFAIAHDAYETWIDHQGVTLKEWLGDIHLPIVHAQSDYSAPLRLGDAFTVELVCTRVGSRSFTLSYVFRSGKHSDSSAPILARLETVHVAVAQGEMRSVSIPDALRGPLEQLMEMSESHSVVASKHDPLDEPLNQIDTETT